jgi:tRNA/rRNA methyltransferase
MITVVLVRTETAQNIGFIARAMANFDVDRLVLVNPLCDHLSDDAMRTAMHAKDVLRKAKILKSMPKADLIIGTTSALGTDYNIPRTPLTAEEFGKKYNPKQKTALVFGNEGNGLTNKEVAMCDFLVSIPASRKYPAMNLSHAVSVVLYELYKQHGNEKFNSHIVKASRKEREIILQLLNDIIEKADFQTKEKMNTQKIVWKKIIEQSMLSKREAFAAIGFLRKLNRN